MTFEDRTVLVTGASRGIGCAVAHALAARGAMVAVHYGRSAEAAHAVVESLDGRGFAVGADLTDPAAPDRLIAEVRQRVDRLDGLVLSAGQLVGGDLEHVTPADVERAFALNVRAPLFLIRAALPLLPPGARVVTVSAALTRWANPELLVQSAAKAALQSLVVHLAPDLGARGIGIVDVAPGVTRTGLASDYLDTPGVEEHVGRVTALGRAGEPDDVARAIVALLSPDAHWITGTVVEASGGYRL
jgi:NAD(P)-dependent dehydrogenase (short-subunit alcohol dehydrogenase family)